MAKEFVRSSKKIDSLMHKVQDFDSMEAIIDLDGAYVFNPEDDETKPYEAFTDGLDTAARLTKKRWGAWAAYIDSFETGVVFTGKTEAQVVAKIKKALANVEHDDDERGGKLRKRPRRARARVGSHGLVQAATALKSIWK